MRLISFVAILLLVCGCAPFVRKGTVSEPLELLGVLSGRTSVGGEILVTGDVRIPPGSTLTIQPGARIRVRDSESTKIDPEYLSPLTEILVQGRLEVNGRPDEEVHIMPERPSPVGEATWAGIILDRAEGSFLRHASLHGPETGVLVIDASPEIISNTISRARYGIVVQGGAPKILDNRIWRGEGGVFIWNGASPYLKNNVIVANDEEGIVVARNCKPYLDRNIVSGNAIGLVVPDKLPFDPTGISGNRRDVLRLSLHQEASR